VKRLIIEYWTPVVIWLFVMFFFSTDAFSADHTSQFIVPFLSFLAPSMSSESLDFWHTAIRKLGHVSEYSILTALTYRSVKQDWSNLVHAGLRTLFCVVVAAALDEIHQHFTLFRTASPIDVGYDTLGAVWALWLITNYEARRLRPHTIL
jgi:VanZ family protein